MPIPQFLSSGTMEIIMKIEELYLTILNTLHDGIYFVDTNRKILFWNKAAENITGYTSDEILGKHCPETMLNHIDEEGRPLCQVGCPLFATLLDGEARKGLVYVRHKEGYRIPVFTNIFPIKENGQITGAIEIFTKDSPKVYDDDLVEHLSGIAMHDALTKLPNRRYAESFLDYKYNEYKKFGRLFAVSFADIDDFRHFNNTYGHATGDNILISVASSIRNNLRKNDLIGRWGGEEFVGIHSIQLPQDALHLAEKLRKLVDHTQILHNDTLLNVSVSVGITVIQPTDTIESLLARADELMYQSKKNGKNRVTSD